MNIKRELQNYVRDFEEMAESLENGNGETWDTQDANNWQAMADNIREMLAELEKENKQ